MDLLSDTFASKPGKRVGGDSEAVSKTEEKPKKGTELKVLDGKTAQNLCKFRPDSPVLYYFLSYYILIFFVEITTVYNLNFAEIFAVILTAAGLA